MICEFVYQVDDSRAFKVIDYILHIVASQRRHGIVEWFKMLTVGNKLGHKTKAEAVTELLREKILRGVLATGEWLRQQDIAREFDISHTPIREALRKLETEGLVEYVAHKGVRVIGITGGDVEEFYLLRSVLECFAVREAIARIDDVAMAELEELERQMLTALELEDLRRLTQINHEWHMAIVSAARRPRLLEMTKRLWAAFPWGSLSTMPGRVKQFTIDHREMMEAIRQRDPDLASQLMEKHMREVASSMIARVRDLGSGRHEDES